MTDFVTDPFEGLRVQTPRAGLAQLGRDALYLTLGLLTSIVALAVWVAGLTLSLSLAAFIVGLPVILASAIAFRWTAELDRLNAALSAAAGSAARTATIVASGSSSAFARPWATPRPGGT